MKLGLNIPITDIGGDPEVIKDFAQHAEGLGYDHLTAADHVLGVNVESRPKWGNRNTSSDYFHDPFVLFGFLSACTQKINFSTQVLVLPQRQTALVAKQAACLDILSGERFRFGIGVGWNHEEFIALNENFHNRGARSVEQVQVMRQLWSKPHVDYKGVWHSLEDIGINPLPKKQCIPVWFGGHQDITLQRTARHGDGWIMLEWPPGDKALAKFKDLHKYTELAGRDPDSIGIEVWVSAAGTPDQWREEFKFWKESNVSHVCLNNTFSRYHHTRISETSIRAHTDAMTRYIEVVRDIM